METQYLLCSNCFYDHGLILDSIKIGDNNNELCPNCKSTNGKKLSESNLINLINHFFVEGSYSKSEYGGAPIINWRRATPDKFDFTTSLRKDSKLIERTLGIAFYYYAPNTWMIGDNIPLEDLKSTIKREPIIDQIIHKFPVKYLDKTNIFYRLRINPRIPNDKYEYDSPLAQGYGRLDSESQTILYGSQDIEVCIHECRASIEDELYVASLAPKNQLKLLDLTERIAEDVDDFDSLMIAILFLFTSDKKSYDITRHIASKVKLEGYDGIIYPSYYSALRTGLRAYDSQIGISFYRLPAPINITKSRLIENIGLFDSPVRDGKVVVKNINRLLLKKADYKYHFGPAKI